MVKLQAALTVCLVGLSHALLKKSKDNNANNGWAQFGFGAPRYPAPGAGYGAAVTAYPTTPYGPPYQSYPQSYYPPRYPQSQSPLSAKYQLPKAGGKPAYNSQYIYPSAYLPAYYMRLDGYGGVGAGVGGVGGGYPASPPREPFLSKLGFGKFRKGDYGGGTTYGPGQGQRVGYRLPPPAPPLAYANYQQEANAIRAASYQGIDCNGKHGDRYLNGDKWADNSPYQYTGHQFGVPLKSAREQEKPQP